MTVLIRDRLRDRRAAAGGRARRHLPADGRCAARRSTTATSSRRGPDAAGRGPDAEGAAGHRRTCRGSRASRARPAPQGRRRPVRCRTAGRGWRRSDRRVRLARQGAVAAEPQGAVRARRARLGRRARPARRDAVGPQGEPAGRRSVPQGDVGPQGPQGDAGCRRAPPVPQGTIGSARGRPVQGRSWGRRVTRGPEGPALGLQGAAMGSQGHGRARPSGLQGPPVRRSRGRERLRGRRRDLAVGDGSGVWHLRDDGRRARPAST